MDGQPNLYSDRVVWNIGYFSLSICRCLGFCKSQMFFRWGSCSQPPSFRGHRTRGGWPPKTKWVNEPCRCFAGEDETFLWEVKKNDTSPVLTTLGVLCCPACLGWPVCGAQAALARTERGDDVAPVHADGYGFSMFFFTQSNIPD